MSECSPKLLFKKRPVVIIFELGSVRWKKTCEKTLSQDLWSLLSIDKRVEICVLVCPRVDEETEPQVNSQLQGVV